jgi:pimeloyl-ACP methyl ester carboxylesterase
MADPREVLTRTAQPGIVVPYGVADDQVVEVFIPDGPARATVVACHGGFWRQEFDRAHLRPFCRGLVDAGFAVVSVEYGRTGGRGGRPVTFNDIESAVRLLDGDVMAGFSLPERTLLSGHSAGGHLALWLASRPWAGPQPPLTRTAPADRDGEPFAAEFATGRVAGVVALAPVSDLVWCYRADLDDGAAVALMGGTPAQLPHEYAAADPARLPVEVPVTVVHGDADDQVPVEMSRTYCRSSGARLQELPGVEHFGLIDPLSSAWPSVLKAFSSLSGN